jgi:hypothetical protein
MFGTNRAPILRRDGNYLQTERNELVVEPCHVGVPSDASKMIYEPTVHLAQTVHLSYIDTNTISKRTETRFHRIDVTKEFHQVHPKRFYENMVLSPQIVNYLASR